MQNRNKTIITMKLDSEDYENIYLRVREKLWLFWASLIALFGGVGLIVLYLSISSATEKAVNKYMKTDEFRKNIIQAIAAKTTELNQRTRKIESSLNISEKRIASLAKLPISIDKNGIILIDQSGNKYFIENGIAEDGESVKFKNAFSNPPILIINATGDAFGSYANRINSIPQKSINTPKVTNQGFYLRNSTYHRTYSWIALGN